MVFAPIRLCAAVSGDTVEVVLLTAPILQWLLITTMTVMAPVRPCVAVDMVGRMPTPNVELLARFGKIQPALREKIATEISRPTWSAVKKKMRTTCPWIRLLAHQQCT